MPVFRCGARILLETAVEPPLGQRERLGSIIARSISRRTLVECHHYVGTYRALGIYHALGRKYMARTVDMRLKMAAVLFEFAARRERKYLKAAAVGQHRTVPCREAVYTARLLDDFHTRAHIEVIGIRQDDLGVSLVAQVAVENTLHRRRRTYRHKYRREYRAVVGYDFCGTSLARRVFILEREFHCIYFNGA